MSKLARQRGHSFEREVAKDFHSMGYKKARRHLEYHATDAEDGIDLVDTGPFYVQAKRGRQYAPINKIFEIKKKGGINLLVTRADNMESMVVMSMDDFKCIVNSLRGVIDG